MNVLDSPECNHDLFSKKETYLHTQPGFFKSIAKRVVSNDESGYREDKTWSSTQTGKQIVGKQLGRGSFQGRGVEGSRLSVHTSNITHPSASCLTAKRNCDLFNPRSGGRTRQSSSALQLPNFAREPNQAAVARFESIFKFPPQNGGANCIRRYREVRCYTCLLTLFDILQPWRERVGHN